MSTETEFIFDAVVGFLTSPIWNVPVRTFIDENCLVFDPDGESHEAYQEIHNKYKNMVETLLASFLKDVGITEEQFMNACKAGSGSPQFSGMNRDVFDQLWAAEDFEVFKRFMTQKNIELQLQALQIIQQRHNVAPTVMPVPYAPQGVPLRAAQGAPLSPPGASDEDAIMQEVLRQSKEEYESQQKNAKGKKENHELEQSLAQSKVESERLQEIAKREQEEMEKVLKMSLESQRKHTAEAEKLRDEVKQSESEAVVKPSPQPTPVAVKTPPKAIPEKSKPTSQPAPEKSKPAPKPTPEKSKPVSKPEPKPSEKSASLPPIVGKAKKPASSSSDAVAGWISSAKSDTASSSSPPPAEAAQVTEEELRRRAEYLKQQRDKLLALKKQEREKRLTMYTEQQPKARPTSARTAHRVTAGEQIDSGASKSSEDDEKKLAMRKALAECLKREVIDKN